MSRIKRWGMIVLLSTTTVLGLGALATWFAVKALKTQIEQALGPESEIGTIQLHWNGAEIRDLRLKAPPDWPATDTLRAKRITVEPEFGSLLSDKVRIARIVIEEAYVSTLRTRDGKLRVVPSLLERKSKEDDKAATAAQAVAIGLIELKNSTMVFYDATLRGKKLAPFAVHLEQLDASVTDLALPDLKEKSRLKFDGTVKGERGDGRLHIEGWIRFADLDSDITTTLRDVDLRALQPYLLKAAETGVKRGTLALDLHATIKDKRLHAPGSVTLNQLELDSSGGSFMGMQRKAAVRLMKDRKGQIAVKFTLDGKLDDPKFSLNESLATRFGAGVAESLGVSIEGIARGAGGLGQKSIEATGSAAKGVGKAVKGIFKK